MNTENRVALSDWTVVKKAPPHDQFIWVSIIAHIKNNETGEIREDKTDAIWDTEEMCPSTFIWEEGNFACDCNRYLFFKHAKDEDADNIQCGHSKYSVNLQNPKTGVFFYKEF
jgi:hypothetical protein